MKRFVFFSLIFTSFLMLFSVSIVKAQQDVAPTNAQNKKVDGEQQRPNLFAELGLSQSQRQQIRSINADKKPLVREAQQRLREANINLDQAIYADNVNETEVQERLKAVQTAHAELIKLRFSNELAVRKILTAEQLAKFRVLREQFAESLENKTDFPPNRPLQNIRQRLKIRQNQMRPNN